MKQDFRKSLFALGAVLGMSACGDGGLVQIVAPDLHARAADLSVFLTWDAHNEVTAYDIWRGSHADSLELLEADYQGLQYSDDYVGFMNPSLSGRVLYYALTAKGEDGKAATSGTVAAFPHVGPTIAGRVYENTSTLGSYYEFVLTYGNSVSGWFMNQAEVDGGRSTVGIYLSTHDGGQPLDPEIRSPHFTGNQAPSLLAEVMTGATCADFNALESHQ